MTLDSYIATLDKSMDKELKFSIIELIKSVNVK